MPRTLESLINTGIIVLRPPAQHAQKTLVVLGAARGGTSLIAGLLHHMGVHMGAKDNSIVYEDVELSGAIESEDTEAVDRIIAERNASYDVWGWKRPAVVKYLDRIEDKLRHPHYIAVFRDIAAIATRNRLSVAAEELANMKESLAHFGRTVSFLEQTRAPTLLISYEKALLSGAALVESLADFAGVPAERVPDRLAEEFIKINLPEYLDATRADRIMGRVSGMQAERVHGWALQKGRELPVEVRLIVNGKTVATTVADRHCADLKERGIHETGCCGFDFELSPEHSLKAGDQVRVRVRGDTKDLLGQPRRFTGPPKRKRGKS